MHKLIGQSDFNLCLFYAVTINIVKSELLGI